MIFFLVWRYLSIGKEEINIRDWKWFKREEELRVNFFLDRQCGDCEMLLGVPRYLWI